jgi:hypothetical protein
LESGCDLRGFMYRTGKAEKTPTIKRNMRRERRRI